MIITVSLVSWVFNFERNGQSVIHVVKLWNNPDNYFVLAHSFTYISSFLFLFQSWLPDFWSIHRSFISFSTNHLSIKKKNKTLSCSQFSPYLHRRTSWKSCLYFLSSVSLLPFSLNPLLLGGFRWFYCLARTVSFLLAFKILFIYLF